MTLDDEADAVLASRYARQEELITLVAKRTMLTAVVALLATPFLFLGWLVWLVVQPAPTLAEATASGHEGRIADAINRTFQEERIDGTIYHSGERAKPVGNRWTVRVRQLDDRQAARLVELVGDFELESLTVEESPMTDAGLAELCGLSEIPVFHLSACPNLSDHGMTHLRTPTFGTVHLTRLEITDDALDDLKHLARSCFVDVSNCRLSREGSQELLAQLRQLWSVNRFSENIWWKNRVAGRV